MDNAMLPVYFLSLLPNTPVYLVWIIGLVLSIIHRRRHSKVSLFTFISLSMFVVISLVGAFLGIWLPVNFYNNGLDAREIGIISMSINVITSLVLSVAWGLIIAAIFGWRKQISTSAAAQPAAVRCKVDGRSDWAEDNIRGDTEE